MRQTNENGRRIKQHGNARVERVLAKKMERGHAYRGAEVLEEKANPTLEAGQEKNRRKH